MFTVGGWEPHRTEDITSMTDNSNLQHDDYSTLRGRLFDQLTGWQRMQQEGRNLGEGMYSAIYRHQVAINKILSHIVECLAKENQEFWQEIEEMKVNA